MVLLRSDENCVLRLERVLMMDDTVKMVPWMVDMTEPMVIGVIELTGSYQWTMDHVSSIVRYELEQLFTDLSYEGC